MRFTAAKLKAANVWSDELFSCLSCSLLATSVFIRDIEASDSHEWGFFVGIFQVSNHKYIQNCWPTELEVIPGF